jgi:CspA family cold shock protein
MPTGSVKMFSADRGYGFIKPDGGGADIFFHVSSVRKGNGEPEPGASVTFEVGVDERSGRPRATMVGLHV